MTIELEKMMEDMKNRLERIEQHAIDNKVQQHVMQSSFETHERQNEKDFQHVDECIHRTEKGSIQRDENLERLLKEIQLKFDEVQQLVWKGVGALLVIVPVINYFVGRFL